MTYIVINFRTMKKYISHFLICILCVLSLGSFARVSNDVSITVKSTNSNVDEKGSRMWIFDVSSELTENQFSKVNAEFSRKAGVKSISYLNNELTVIALPFISLKDLEGIFRMAEINLVDEALGSQSLIQKINEEKLSK